MSEKRWDAQGLKYIVYIGKEMSRKNHARRWIVDIVAPLELHIKAIKENGFYFDSLNWVKEVVEICLLHSIYDHYGWASGGWCGYLMFEGLVVEWTYISIDDVSYHWKIVPIRNKNLTKIRALIPGREFEPLMKSFQHKYPSHLRYTQITRETLYYLSVRW